MHHDLEDTAVPRDALLRPAAAAAPGPVPQAAESETPSYGFRVGGSSRTILLDQAAVVGRAPTAPRVPTGAPPRLVRVRSPLGEVSSTHLEVRQLGTSVVVTDLRSTNGSVVIVPGHRHVVQFAGARAVAFEIDTFVARGREAVGGSEPT